jgi:hypothetical protein
MYCNQQPETGRIPLALIAVSHVAAVTMSAETGEAMLKNDTAVAIPKGIDFMAVTPLDEPPQPPPASLSQSSFVN